MQKIFRIKNITYIRIMQIERGKILVLNGFVLFLDICMMDFRLDLICL